MDNTNNGWRGKPGVPLNPEQSDWHWLAWGNEKPTAVEWGSEHWFNPDEPENGHWCFGGGQYGTAKEVADDGWTYLGPVLSHDQTTALQARVAELKRLVQCLIDVDPEDMAADGVTVLDVWREEARAALEGKKDDV